MAPPSTHAPTHTILPPAHFFCTCDKQPLPEKLFPLPFSVLQTDVENMIYSYISSFSIKSTISFPFVLRISCVFVFFQNSRGHKELISVLYPSLLLCFLVFHCFLALSASCSFPVWVYVCVWFYFCIAMCCIKPQKQKFASISVRMSDNSKVKAKTLCVNQRSVQSEMFVFGLQMMSNV